jgi:hypothetical protein
MQQVHRKREVWAIERTIDGDFGQMTLRVELAFDNRKGQFRITQQITTEQVSRNDAHNTAMLTQLNAMNREAFAKGLELLDDWTEANPGEGQGSLFDQTDEDSPGTMTNERGDAFGVYTGGKPASNATEVGLPSTGDGETVDTDAMLAQMRKDQKAERDRKYRERKRQGTLVSDNTENDE